jgi:hypothetical protein
MRRVDPAEREDRWNLVYADEIDGVILMTLCDEPGHWRLDELERELGGGVRIEDGVARLARRGLVHRLDGDFVISTAAGRYALAVNEETP